MKKILLPLLLLALSPLGLQAKINRPRLVVGVMVDQMRWDYFYYYYCADSSTKAIVAKTA